MLNRGTFRRASSHIPPRPRSRSDTSARALTLTAVACVHGRHNRPAMKTLGDLGAQPPRKGGSGRSPPEMFWNFGVNWRDLKHFYSKLHLVGLQFSRVILLHIRFSSTAITYRSFKAWKYLALALLSLVLVRYPLGIELRPKQWFRFFQSLIWHAAFFIVLEPPLGYVYVILYLVVRSVQIRLS